MKVTVATFAKMKQEKQKIACLTCYDASTAKIIDASNWNRGPKVELIIP